MVGYKENLPGRIVLAGSSARWVQSRRIFPELDREVVTEYSNKVKNIIRAESSAKWVRSRRIK